MHSLFISLSYHDVFIVIFAVRVVKITLKTAADSSNDTLLPDIF